MSTGWNCFDALKKGGPYTFVFISIYSRMYINLFITKLKVQYIKFDFASYQHVVVLRTWNPDT
jgi:hypothetical protein